MANGYTFKKGRSWFLRYWHSVSENGQIVRRQKCEWLAFVSDRYRGKKDLADLVKEKLDGIQRADKCPRSSDSFINYAEEVYLPFVLRTMKPSTYAGYSTYWLRYLKPRVGKYALRDFTVAIVAGLLKDIASTHELNRDTVTKVRSVLSGIFTFAMSEGHYPARNASENPASHARIPETAKKSVAPKAATRDEVKDILGALQDMPLERAAVAIMAMLGTRPGEARGLRWSDWDRVKQQIKIERAVWHTFEHEPKTLQSVRLVAVTAELREVLLSLWKQQGSPLEGYILAGRRSGKALNLDNLSRRVLAPLLKTKGIEWHGWYSLRRFHGTAVRAESNLETTSRALGNSKAVADKHYVKPEEVLPDVRKAVNDAVSGLTVVQRVCNERVN